MRGDSMAALTTTDRPAVVLAPEAADAWVAEWMAAWNSHDVDAIAAHYADDVEYYSPVIAQLADPSGRLDGIEAVRAYIAAALEKYPDLHFDPPAHVAMGAGSVVFVYRSIGGLLAIETLVFAPDGKVGRAHCHYRPTSGQTDSGQEA